MPGVLSDFGFASTEIKVTIFQNKDNIIRIGSPPYRIDIMTEIDGVTFDDCYKNKITEEIDSTKMNFIGYSDLIKNKKASGRKQDQLDLDNLQ
jgi:hypothetical protein